MEAVLAFLALFIAIGAYPEKAPAAEYTLRLSGTVAQDHLITTTEYYFRDRVAELSNGRLVIEVYPNGQLGSPREMLEATVMGDCDMVETAMIMTAGYTNKFKFMNLPFLWNSKKAAHEFMLSPKGQELCDAAMQETNMITLGYIDNGFFNFSANRIIDSPEKCAGFKMRCQESDILLQTWKDFGANPTPLSFAELYTALQQGAIDGQMNGYMTTAKHKIYEVQKYCHSLGVMYDMCTISINKDVYDSLPKDLQEVLHKAMTEAEIFGFDLSEKEYVKARQEVIDNGVEIIDLMVPEKRQPWLDKAKATYDWFRATYPEEKIDDLLEAVKPFNEKYPTSAADVI